MSQHRQLNSDMSSESELPGFLQNFSPIFHYRRPKKCHNPWVFWSESEGSENNSSSADLGTAIIHDKIKSLLSNSELYWGCLAQFWAPVTIDGKRLLSTLGQPFSAHSLSNQLAKYRLNSKKYKYNIDANKLDIELDNMIKSGGPAIAFLNCRTSMGELQESDDYGGLNFSVMFPICFPSQSNCIGVLEFTLDISKVDLPYFICYTVRQIKKGALDVFYVQDLIPYKTINGLKLAKDHIEEALKVVCESHKLSLAQVWIPYEDKSRVFLSSSLEDTQTKQLLAIKLLSYYAMKDDACLVEPYIRFCDITPHEIGEEFPLLTLQDYKSRYMSKLRYDMAMRWGNGWFASASGLAICLRSNDTGDYNYVFEFIWIKDSNCVINIDLEAILLTLKRCLPGFKFASGVEIGNELDIHSEHDETKMFKIFKGKRSMVVDYIAHSEVTPKTTPKVLPREEVIQGDATGVEIGNELDVHIEGDETGAELGDELDIHSEDDETNKFKIFQGKRSIVVDLIAPSNVSCKTTAKVLPREVIEKQFGKTMKEAANNLNVSLSTLKRKCIDLDIREWPGPNFLKRKANGLAIIQSNTNDEDTGAIEDTSAVNLNKCDETGVDIGNELDVHIEGDETGAKLGDELDIHSEDDDTKKFKIFQEKRSMDVDHIAHSEVTCKTTPKVLAQEVIEGDETGVDIGNKINVYIEGDETGAELGDQLDIHSEDHETKRFKIFQGKRSMDADYIAHSELMCKKTPTVLPREVIQGDETGVDIGNELDVIVEKSTDGTKKLKIFQEKKPAVVNNKKPSRLEGRPKTATIELILKDVEKQFGKTMEEAAKSLGVSTSTLKRKWNKFSENSGQKSKPWPGPNEEVDRAIQERSTDNITLTIEAEYADGTEKLKGRPKTAPIELSLKDVEKQFGKTMEEAAKSLGVSTSTLQRRWKEFFKNSGQESKPWPGPKLVKKKAKDSTSIQIDINEEIDRAIQERSTDNITLTIEAEYAGDIIKFPLHYSQATFEIIEEKVGTKFKLSVGTYKLKYLDEAGRWILLTSDEEMSYCIESSRKSDGRIVVQLKLYHPRKPISSPVDSCSTE